MHRIWVWMRQEVNNCNNILKPTYCDRMVLLLLGNIANWALAISGIVTTPIDFASYLLMIFLTNLILYIIFYIIMKVIIFLMNFYNNSTNIFYNIDDLCPIYFLYRTYTVFIFKRNLLFLIMIITIFIFSCVMEKEY